MSRGRHRAKRNWGATTGRHTRLAAGVIAVAATGALAAPAAADPGGVNWDAVAACEASGNWAANTGNGFMGGLQWSPATFHANGGVGSPAAASRDAQIAVANHVIATQGAARGLANWPVCGAHAHDGGATITTSAPRHAATPAPAIQLPASTPPRHAAPPAPTYTGPTADRTVAAGETLSAIAGTLDWRELWALNRATVTDPDVVQPGQVLKVPAPVPAATLPVIDVNVVSPLVLGMTH